MNEKKKELLFSHLLVISFIWIKHLCVLAVSSWIRMISKFCFLQLDLLIFFLFYFMFFSLREREGGCRLFLWRPSSLWFEIKNSINGRLFLAIGGSICLKEIVKRDLYLFTMQIGFQYKEFHFLLQCSTLSSIFFFSFSLQFFWLSFSPSFWFFFPEKFCFI